MDYRIKFEYKSGAIQKAGAVRQKVIQAQKDAAKKAGVSGKSDSQLISSIKTLGSNMRKLESTIQKLISSNKSLKQSVESAAAAGAGVGAAAGAGRLGAGRMAGVGAAAASIPGIAMVGFAIRKISQIGTAYMERAAMQARAAGMAGMAPRKYKVREGGKEVEKIFPGLRTGQDMYMGADIAAGMREYAIKTGKFAYGKAAPRGVTGIGGFLGLEAPEVLGQAGVYKRAGIDYVKTARQAAGMGIQSELPILLSGIASELEEAVKNGINTSDLSKDMGKEFALLTQKTAGKSVEAAMKIARSFGGVKKAVEAGKIPGIQELYATQAVGEILVERLREPGYAESLEKRGIISKAQKEKIQKAKPTTPEMLQETIGPTATQALRMFTAQETSDAKVQRRSMQIQQKQWGKTPEAFQRYAVTMAQMEPGFDYSQRYAVFQAAKEKLPVGVEARGAGVLKAGIERVQKSGAAMSIQIAQERERMLFQYGQSFADVTVKMEKAMINIADVVAPGAAKSIKVMGDAATAAANALGDIKKTVLSWLGEDKKAKNNEGNYTDK